MLNKLFILFFPLIFFLGGCALQSSLVSLEQDFADEAEQRKKTSDNIETLRTQLEGLVKEVRAEKPKVNNQKGITSLIEEVDRLKGRLRQLEGRIEEEGRKTSEALRATDDQAHAVDTLSSRLTNIEKRLSSEKETTEGTKTSPLLSPTEAYNLAYNDYLRGNYDLAILGFQNYLNQYPNSLETPQALYWIGQSHYNQSAYADAISFFEQIETRFPKHNTTPNAMLKMGFSYIELSKVSLAKVVLQRVITRFPESNEANLAKDKLATIN